MDASKTLGAKKRTAFLAVLQAILLVSTLVLAPVQVFANHEEDVLKVVLECS